MLKSDHFGIEMVLIQLLITRRGAKIRHFGIEMGSGAWHLGNTYVLKSDHFGLKWGSGACHWAYIFAKSDHFGIEMVARSSS